MEFVAIYAMVGNEDITMADSTMKKKKNSIISHLVIFLSVYLPLRRLTTPESTTSLIIRLFIHFSDFNSLFNMASQSDSMLQNQQEKYIRGRENPVFDGLRGNTSMNHRTSIFDFLGRNGNQKISRSNSVIGHAGCKGGIQENASSYTSSKGSQFDIREEPFGLSFSRSLDLGSSKIAGIHSESSIDMSVPKDFEANGVHGDREEPLIEKSFSVSKRKEVLPVVSLPPSAASFYYRGLPSMDVVESCQGIQRLNLYLKACKDAVNVGVPGQFLRAVLGHVSDAGSFISTIMYSFYLNETDKNSQFCTVPIINIKRADIKAYAELEWLLTSCNIDQPSIIFINEIDLSYYNLFGSLKVVLLNADKLPEKQEALKESLVEIFKGKKGGFVDLSDDTVEEQECSCCALIAEKFASISPEILAGKGFSRLLLSGILLDTENLRSPKCTSVDKYMSTLLLNGAGRFGCNGVYKILSDKMHNVSYLSVGQILQKDFRKWTKPGKAESVGMSAVGMSISQLLSHDETSIQEIILFQQMNKLSLLIIVSGYHNLHKSFKEMLISAESKELIEDLLHFLNNHPPRLPLHVLHQSGLCDEMRAFSMDNTTSLTIMEQLLEDFCKEGKFFNYQPIKSFVVTR